MIATRSDSAIIGSCLHPDASCCPVTPIITLLASFVQCLIASKWPIWDKSNTPSIWIVNVCWGGETSFIPDAGDDSKDHESSNTSWFSRYDMISCCFRLCIECLLLALVSANSVDPLIAFFYHPPKCCHFVKAVSRFSCSELCVFLYSCVCDD